MAAERRRDLDATLAWSALRAADGSVELAARALGISPRSLLEAIRISPALQRSKSGIYRSGRSADEGAQAGRGEPFAGDLVGKASCVTSCVTEDPVPPESA
jgi:hypothetical protein